MMQNFTFHNPTKILFGAGRIADIAKEIPKNLRVLITYGGGSVKKTGVLDEVLQALDGYETCQFGGIEPNPTYETLMEAVDLVSRHDIGFILAVGGGSVIDGSKFIAAAAHFTGAGDAWDILAKHARVKSALPLGTVLTLPATGSEMNSFSVVSRQSTREKLGFSSPLVFPRFSVLDPAKTYTLPPRQVANGVVDAFAHVMEQYLTFPADAPLQDRFAESLLLTLIEEGPKALAEPENYAVRANIMWCATLGLNGLIGAGVPQDWTTHMIGHEITAEYGLDHAQTLAVVMPAVMTVRRAQKRAKLLHYAARIWGLTEGGEDERIDAAIARTRAFFESLGVKTSLGGYGIGAEAVPVVVERLTAHGMTALGERQDVTPEVVADILTRSL